MIVFEDSFLLLFLHFLVCLSCSLTNKADDESVNSLSHQSRHCQLTQRCCFVHAGAASVTHSNDGMGVAHPHPRQRYTFLCRAT